MSSFTGGKWEWSQERTKLYTESVIILETKRETTKEDARLIAAAPEMYSLLNKAHSMLYRLTMGELTVLEFMDLKKLIKESGELLRRIDGEDAEHE